MAAVPILLYHSVAPDASPEYRRWCVRPADFDAHLSVVDELDMQPMTVSDFVDARSGDRLPARPCLITFDDGRRDFVDHAMPILQAHAMSSTMYVVTDHIGGSSAWLPIDAERNQPMMSWDEVRQIAAAGVEVGAHSRSHAELDVLDRATCRAEVAGSRERLGTELGASVRSFAYPHGYHSRQVVDAVRSAGFDSACAVNDRWCLPGDDRFALSRQFVWATTTPEDLRRMLTDPPSGGPVATCRAAARRTAGVGWRAVRRIRHETAGGRR